MSDEPERDAARNALGTAILTAQGFLLGLGSGSALLVTSGHGPLGKSAASLEVLVGYGVASAALVLATAIALFVRSDRRGLPAEWVTATRRFVALPVGALAAGCGTCFYATTYEWLAAVQWGLGATPPWTLNGIAAFAPSLVLTPLAFLTIAAAARSTGHAIFSIVVYCSGFICVKPIAGGILEQILGLEPPPPDLPTLGVTALGGVLLARVLAEQRRDAKPGIETTANVAGFGTALLGRRDERPDGSYVSTKFIAALFAPLFPLMTIRVRPLAREERNRLTKTHYELLERVPLDLALAAKSFVLGWLTGPFLMLWPVVLLLALSRIWPGLLTNEAFRKPFAIGSAVNLLVAFGYILSRPRW